MPRPPVAWHSFITVRRQGWLRKRPASPRAIWRWKPVCSTYIISFRIPDVFVFFGGGRLVGGKDGVRRKAAWIFRNFKMLKCKWYSATWRDASRRLGNLIHLTPEEIDAPAKIPKIQVEPLEDWSKFRQLHRLGDQNMNLPLGTHYMIFYEYSNIVASHIFFAPDPNREIIQVDSSLTRRFSKWVENHQLRRWRQICWHPFEFCPFSPAFLRSVFKGMSVSLQEAAK